MANTAAYMAKNLPHTVLAGRPEPLEFNGLRLMCGAATVELTGQEGRIVALLVKNFGSCVRNTAIFDDLYGLDPNGGPETKIIPIFVVKIRAKLVKAGAPLAIRTHWGLGYELVHVVPE